MGIFGKLFGGEGGGNPEAQAEADRMVKARELAEQLTAPYTESMDEAALANLKGTLSREAQTLMKGGASAEQLTERLNARIAEQVGTQAPAEAPKMEAAKGVASEAEMSLAKTLAEQKGNPAALRRLVQEVIGGMGEIDGEQALQITNNVVDSFANNPTSQSFLNAASPEDSASLVRLVREIQNQVGPAVGTAEEMKSAA